MLRAVSRHFCIGGALVAVRNAREECVRREALAWWKLAREVSEKKNVEDILHTHQQMEK